ncbi:MAG: zinc-ribbon domain-containing protein, partial [Oceanidesulfovibrio sp.]
MKIVCPECGFARELQEDKIPPTAQVATCPKCRHKFKFRELPQERPIHFSDEPEEETRTTPPPHETAPPPPYDAPIVEEEEDDIYYPEPDSGQEAMQAREVPTPEVEDDVYEPANDPDAVPGPPMDEGDIWNRLESMGKTGESGSRTQRSAGGASGDETNVPWENLQAHGFFGGLAQTVRLAMFSAPSFFAKMRVGGGILRPLA